MSCRNAYEIDLAAFLADPSGAAWAVFRDHYPRCTTCSAEVRVWTELETALGTTRHPDPEDLVRWVDATSALAPAARRRIADHVTGCTTCRDEAHTLRRFDPRAAPALQRTTRRRPRLWTAIGRVLWHPALAYAVALVLGLYPLLTSRMPPHRAQPAGVEMDRLEKKQKVESPPAAEPPMRSLRENALASHEGLGDAPRERRAAKDDEATTRAAASVGRLDASFIPATTLLAGAEASLTIMPDATEITLRVEPAPTGTNRVRVSDPSGQRMLVAAGTGTIRVPAVWLTPGHYVVELLDDDRTLATARLTVER